MKWGTIVPLIGGLSVAAKQVTGEDPSFFLSYKPFGENELNAKAYFKNTPHYLLDDENRGGFDLSKNQDVDFVNAVCPCAGLSLLSSGNPEQRAKMNHWMLESARFVTEEVKPKVFWGENAPALYSNGGKHVREQLRDIATKNGYSFSIYATNTMLHGIPQSRKRTFYFFWKDSPVPVFDYYKRPTPSFEDYLELVPDNSIHHQAEDLQVATDHLLKNPYIMFLQHKYNDRGIDDMRRYLVEKDMRGFTLLTYLLRTEQLEEARDWMKANGHEKHYKEAERVLAKVRSKGGFWDGSFPIYRGTGEMATLISRTLYTIHPKKDRVLTTRECMHMMGLPHDFELVTGATNNICQNVPVCTGADMTREVVKFIKGESTLSNATFMMQSNLSERIDVSESSLLSF
jgi:site-specific DNA-cytosine methylase